jgi:peptidoglycan/LPS O-acetylase OafA/YrhL
MEPAPTANPEPKTRPVVDYARPDAAKKSLIPGRAALACIIAALLLYGVLLALVPDDAENLVNAMIVVLLALFSAGFITSIIAVARRASRTIPAWIALALGIAWWLFYFGAVFSGM